MEPPRLLSDSFKVIVAFDIGTIYSGLAYAHKGEIDLGKGTFNVECPQAWNTGNPAFNSKKTATCILLSKDKELKAFGFDAENKFCKIASSGQHEDYYFFRRFKMDLYKEKITPNLHLKDETGKKLPAQFVFGKCIFAMKEKFWESMDTQKIALEPDEIRYVVTVPAIWTDAAKQFMRQAANEAGIKDDQLVLALEPEAASIYSQFVKLKGKNDPQISAPKVGTHYLVADLGGGTADFAVHTNLGNGFVKEVHRSRGDDCGGDSINDSFTTEMISIFGGPFIKSIKEKYPIVNLEIHRALEAAKKTVDGLQKDDMVMLLPYHIINEYSKSMANERLQETIQLSKYGDRIQIRDGYIYINQSLALEKLFQPTTKRIIDILQNIVSEVEDCDQSSNTKIQNILLVGGFSESKYIQKAVEEAFPKKVVIAPESSDLCVMKGAVMFGHSPGLISQRVMLHTYGVRSNKAFDYKLHDKERKFVVKNKEYCKDTICVYVKCGSIVDNDTSITKSLSTMYSKQKRVTFPVIISSDTDPIYADGPGCKEIGELSVEITNPTEEDKSYDVSLVFGNPEIQIKAKDEVTGEKYNAKLNFIMY